MAPTDGDGDGDGDGDDDDSAFAEAMRGARPLPSGHPRVTGPPAAEPRRKRAPAAAAAGCETATTPSGETASTEDENRHRTSQRAQCAIGCMKIAFMCMTGEWDQTKPAPIWPHASMHAA